MKKTILLSAIACTVYLSACNSNADKKQAAPKTAEKQLTGSVTKPADFTFKNQDFENMGKMDFPTGADWKREGIDLSNKKLGITLIIQSQNEDFTDQIKEYTESFISINKKDAPKYEVTSKEEGVVNGVKAVKVEGKFNNGKPYITRDYIFFTKKKVATLMCKVGEKNKAKITVVDYMVSTLK